MQFRGRFHVGGKVDLVREGVSGDGFGCERLTERKDSVEVADDRKKKETSVVTDRIPQIDRNGQINPI